MSKTQLQTNNTRLSQLITELQGKAVGGGSGGSVETCTVVLRDADNASYLYSYLFTTYENGEFSAAYYVGNIRDGFDAGNLHNGFDITIPNVVCGTSGYLYVSCYDLRTDGGIEMVAQNNDIAIVTVSTTSGETATLNMYGSD